MKQFSLKEYLENPSRKIVTRDGRNVKIHCTNYYLGNNCIIAEVEGIGSSYSYNNRGLLYGTMSDSPLDIFFAPEKEEAEKQEEDSLDKPTAERFDVNTLKPFDKILVKDAAIGVEWEGSFFCYRDLHYCNGIVCINGQMRYMAIPYNEETKHLLGTTKDCPEYYKWWEE